MAKGRKKPEWRRKGDQRTAHKTTDEYDLFCAAAPSEKKEDCKAIRESNQSQQAAVKIAQLSTLAYAYDMDGELL